MLENRRNFIKKSIILGAALSLPMSLPARAATVHREFKTRNAKNALVLYYSQTGLTSRYGKLIACILKEKGLTVDALDMQGFDKNRLTRYDLIIVGTPVFYYDIPANVSDWLAGIPSILGTPVAAFASFGGPEGNQNNAVCHTLHLLTDKGGIAVGHAAFRSIPAYPTPNWDGPNQVSGQHLPNEATYEQVRRFTGQILVQVSRGESIAYESQLAAREFLRMLPLVWLNKKMISRHTVDAATCINCQICVKKCPTGAINPAKQFVDGDKCLACFGCLNNCPVGAVVMEYGGKRLYGFPEYLRRRKINILEPVEFQSCRL